MTRFRTGMKLGRTIYIQRGEWADQRDTFIGIMDTPALGELVCIALNRLADLDPDIVAQVARQVAEEKDQKVFDHLSSQPDQRSVNPHDAGGATMPVDDQH